MSSMDSLMAPFKGISGLHKWVAIILALLVLIPAFFGKSLGLGCPTVGATAPVAAVPAAVPAAIPAAVPAAVPALAPAVNRLGWTWADGKLTLTGEVKDEATRKSIFDEAVKRMGSADKVVDNLKINAAAETVAFTDKFDDIAGMGVNGMGVAVEGRKVVLTGTVPLEGDKKQKGEAAARAFGSDYTIDNQIVVKAPDRPEPVSLFFDTGKYNVQADANKLLEGIIAYGNASPNAKIQLSGFHDKRGNVNSNKELAKNRALAVAALLKKAGLAEDRIVLVPPTELVGAADDKMARRVDVGIAQ